MLQLLVSLLDAFAHLLEPRLLAHLLPIRFGGWGAGRSMILTHTGEMSVLSGVHTIFVVNYCIHHFAKIRFEEVLSSPMAIFTR